jgi:hypothetical protein
MTNEISKIEMVSTACWKFFIFILMNTKTEKYKPAVNKQYLLILSGAMWMGVGIMLNVFAFTWLRAFKGNHHFVYAGIGIICALVIHHFGFLKIVDKNLGRISRMEGKPCVFSFMSWKSYLIVMVMVTMGIAFRHSSLPKQYLSILYIGIGGALILSSIRYFRVLINQLIAQSHH